jgi:hypothetical protein
LVVASAAWLGAAAVTGCSSKTEDIAAGPGTGGNGNPSAGANAAAGANANGGGNAAGGNASNGGNAPSGGNAPNAGNASVGGNAPQGGNNTTGGVGTAGNGGGPGGGQANNGGSAGSGDTGMDSAPPHPLNVTASAGEHFHNADKAGMDGRAKSLGKLVVDIGVNEGGYSGFLAKRGYHSIGAPCGACPAPDLDTNRTDVGNCRLTEWATTKAYVFQKVTKLAGDYPEEDWAYFLTADKKEVRWSEVAITGISHGATTAAIAGRLGARMWRIVSRSGPRDNVCGKGDGKCTMPLSTPSYDLACADSDVAEWLDKPSLTPMDRFYGIVGMTDGQCGDIMFNMHRTKYIGEPMQFDVDGADLTKSHQLFAAGQGHYDFLAAPAGVKNGNAVLEEAFGIPAENRNPKF